VVLILVVAWPVVRPQRTAAPGGGAGAAQRGSGPGAVDLSSMSPRQAADQLYTRVMSAAEVGDSATASFFVPMAMSAYEQARPLDADGLFHLASLQRVAGDFAGAIATAGEALANEPDHLLNLYVAAEASREMGEAGRAREYFQRILDAWDREMASGHADYQAHLGMMDNVRQTAANFVAVTGG
jgi:tetratricopeptide (TPR) repeat protein